MDVYSYVGRDLNVPDHNEIFLHPLMLNEMRLGEMVDTDDSKTEKYILFLCIKLVHEVSHILNFKLVLFPKATLLTHKKKLIDINPMILEEYQNLINTLMSKKPQSEKDEQLLLSYLKTKNQINKIMIEDFGVMMEIRLFGGTSY